jgi:hypothetical protein
MSQTLHPKDAEKQVFRLATLDDGIWEIYLGLFFTLMSLYPLTRKLLGPAWNIVLVTGVLLALVGFVWLLKRSLTLPRTGVVKFNQGTKSKIRIANIITWVLVLGTFAVMILSANRILNEPTWKKLPKWFTDFDVDLVFALLIFACFAVIASAMSLPRFYLHGLLLGISNFAATVLLVYNDVKFQWPVAIAGSIIAIIGAFELVRFLQKYPVPEMETVNGG